jgi:hypothetical protein
MSDWLALSDLTIPESPDRVIEHGLFVCEVSMPASSGTVLLDWQTTGFEPRTFSVFIDQEMGIVLMYREGKAMRRHCLPGPLPFGIGTARITYAWDKRSGKWSLTFGRLGMGEECRACGINPICMSTALLAAICRPDGAGLRHPSLLWFGVTQGASPPERAPWIGLRTPIETVRGPVPAGHLVVGDLICTADNGLQPVLGLQRLRLPSRGSFAPVVVRAPFLRQGTDVLMSADQLVLISGTEVEYMFGVEEALISAGALANGSIAILDGLHASTDCISIDLGLPELMLVDGLEVLSHSATFCQPSRKVLLPYEAQQLVSLMARRSLQGAA